MNQQGVVLATAGYDHCIRFWDATTGASTRVLKVTDSQVNALAISPDKRLVAAACNPCVKVFDLARSGGEGSPVAYLDVSFFILKIFQYFKEHDKKTLTKMEGFL